MEIYLNERPSFVLFLPQLRPDVTRQPIEIYGLTPTSWAAILAAASAGHAAHDHHPPGLFAAGDRRRQPQVCAGG